jgi:cobalt-zinc-cadmium efflux system membrane fusion protein
MTDSSHTHAEPKRRALSTRQQLTILVLVSVIALAIFVGGPLIGRALSRPPPPAAPPSRGAFKATDQQWQTLTIQPVQVRSFADVATTDGKIATDDDVTTNVFSPYSGRVTRVFARAGDTVAAGAPLFAIEAQEIVQAQSDLASTSAQLDLATATEARQHELYEAKGAALKDWQQSQLDLVNAKAAFRAARDKLRILGSSEAEVDAQATRPHAVARAETIVRAPRSGVVMQRAVSAGQNIASLSNGGSTAAFVVSDLSKIWLVGNLREVQAPIAKVGQTVEVSVTALPGQTFLGRLDFVAPSVDPVSRRVAVRATVNNAQGLLKPEMFAQFSVVTGPRRSSVAVPEEAVVYEGEEARVWVAQPTDKTLTLRAVKPGRTANREVEILSGLKPGDRIVTEGSLFIDRAARGE